VTDWNLARARGPDKDPGLQADSLSHVGVGCSAVWRCRRPAWWRRAGFSPSCSRDGCGETVVGTSYSDDDRDHLLTAVRPKGGSLLRISDGLGVDDSAR
jgi:hypothetical protein